MAYLERVKTLSGRVHYRVRIATKVRALGTWRQERIESLGTYDTDKPPIARLVAASHRWAIPLARVEKLIGRRLKPSERVVW